MSDDALNDSSVDDDGDDKDDYKDDHDDDSRHAGQDAGNSRGLGERGLQLTGDRILLQFWRADDELDRMGELSSDG